MLLSKHVLVTGAARGIGAAIARALADEDATITLMGRHESSLEESRANLGRGSHRHGVVVADVTDERQVETAFAKARNERGPVHILVNNAGQAQSAPFATTSLELWERMVSANLTGTFLCCKAALPGMIEQGGGRIINIASTAAQKGYAYVSAYVAAKHGVLGLTRALALEVARKSITVNAVCPGYTDTDILREGVANVVAKTGRSEQDALAEFARGNPQQRIVRPEEVADAVRWLCSSSASAITGQAISVAGGEVM
jgi:NAD(P)-dependent dehydrogenase (short-subunit alcohol dehydrogenase family)